jgi:hypothetical protein
MKLRLRLLNLLFIVDAANRASDRAALHALCADVSGRCSATLAWRIAVPAPSSARQLASRHGVASGLRVSYALAHLLPCACCGASLWQNVFASALNPLPLCGVCLGSHAASGCAHRLPTSQLRLARLTLTLHNAAACASSGGGLQFHALLHRRLLLSWRGTGMVQWRTRLCLASLYFAVACPNASGARILPGCFLRYGTTVALARNWFLDMAAFCRLRTPLHYLLRTLLCCCALPLRVPSAPAPAARLPPFLRFPCLCAALPLSRWS